MDEKIRYIFKKKYQCQFGDIAEGREINIFRGILFMDGIMIPEPYASDIKKLFNDDKFLKEYIRTEKAIENKV
jgi:hypothetical protein